MVIIPPRHYCVVENPVMRDSNGEIIVDSSGQARLCHADLDIRLAQEPFPLYPGEALKQPLTPLTVVVANSALRLMAILDFEDDNGDKRTAGDEWLFEGPGMSSLGSLVTRWEALVGFEPLPVCGWPTFPSVL